MSNDFIWRTEVYRATAFILNKGAPLAPSTAVYEGLEIEGVQDFVPNYPTPRAIPGIAQGRVRDTIYLPSLEAQTALMHTLYDHLSNNALLQGVKKYTEGGRDHVPYNTNKQGQEPDVILLVSALVTHNQDGDTVWNHFIIPRARIIPIGSPLNANASQYGYNVAISKSLKEAWGVPLTEAIQGCTEMGILDIVSNERMNMVFWKSDGSEDTYPLPVEKPAVEFATNFKVYDYTDGVDLTADATLSATEVVIYGGYIPAVDHILAGVYEF